MRSGPTLRHRRSGVRQGPGRDPPVPAARPDAYALRAGGHQADGLITGYYEPIYAGSLTRTDNGDGTGLRHAG
jgi:hypothetical protein